MNGQESRARAYSSRGRLCIAVCFPLQCASPQWGESLWRYPPPWILTAVRHSPAFFAHPPPLIQYKQFLKVDYEEDTPGVDFIPDCEFWGLNLHLQHLNMSDVGLSEIQSFGSDQKDPEILSEKCWDILVQEVEQSTSIMFPPNPKPAEATFKKNWLCFFQPSALHSKLYNFLMRTTFHISSFVQMYIHYLPTQISPGYISVAFHIA